ncbi:uncharacterized protein LOC122010236 [Zingiber officinale]|uniref:Uncharacterized protein n=1 Tax=Zingiber officinale TaxID=94328 RepID=A0A8J5FMM4_ZINOF|nr:uncharacterized protein LOC122010236 [Zingiber officinale]KAG6488048.1 hypothetical protein ZIOFF_056806 [Zingiber officinale]
MATERPAPATFPYFSSSPSFGRAPVEYEKAAYDGSDSPTFGVAHRLETLPPPAKASADGDDEEYDASSDDFEFSVESNGAFGFPPADADEIFCGGRMLPVYPVFNRDLIRRPAEAEEPEADTIPIRKLLIAEKEVEREEHQPERCKKSASTGTLRGLFRSFTIGRSQSDGRDKFVFIEASAPGSASAKKMISNKVSKKGPRAAEADAVTANPPLYGKGTTNKAVKGPRRSFLPYRQELLGLFAPANALTHNTHKRNPFYY